MKDFLAEQAKTVLSAVLRVVPRRKIAVGASVLIVGSDLLRFNLLGLVWDGALVALILSMYWHED